MNGEKAQHMCFISCLCRGQSESGPTQDVLGQCGWELMWEALGTGRDTCDWPQAEELPLFVHRRFQGDFEVVCGILSSFV